MSTGPKRTKLKRTITLENGVRLSVRPIRPSDRAALHAFFHALSSETRYRRFMGHVAELSPTMLTYLTEVDGEDHLAVVAFAAPTPSLKTLRDRFTKKPAAMLGVARIVRLTEDRSVGEVAVTVADELQGKGLGSALLGMLVPAATERGIDQVVAHMLDDNVRMKAILAKNGALKRRGDGMLAVRVERAADAPSAIERALIWGRGSAARGETARRELARRFFPLAGPRRLIGCHAFVT